MPTAKERITIRTDRDTLWALLTAPDQILQWYAGVDSMKSTPNFPAVGSSLEWTHKVMGVELKGTNTVQEIKPGALVRYQLSGMITGTWDWRVTEGAGGLELETEADYKIGGGVLGKIAEPVFHQTNVANARKSLENVKKMAEG